MPQKHKRKWTLTAWGMAHNSTRAQGSSRNSTAIACGMLFVVPFHSLGRHFARAAATVGKEAIRLAASTRQDVRFANNCDRRSKNKRIETPNRHQGQSGAKEKKNTTTTSATLTTITLFRRPLPRFRARVLRGRHGFVGNSSASMAANSAALQKK